MKNKEETSNKKQHDIYEYQPKEEKKNSNIIAE
jgi:hypothetical protein